MLYCAKLYCTILYCFRLCYTVILLYLTRLYYTIDFLDRDPKKASSDSFLGCMDFSQAIRPGAGVEGQLHLPGKPAAHNYGLLSVYLFWTTLGYGGLIFWATWISRSCWFGT